jgi:predicted nucleic acid-binding protein
MILLDTSGLLAALFADQRQHGTCAEALRRAKPPLLLSPFVLAELDYLVTKLTSVEVELELLVEVAGGAYELCDFDFQDVDEARSVIRGHRDLGLRLADASLVVLSRRFDCLDVLTLDARHFRALRGARNRAFRMLPADLAR